MSKEKIKVGIIGAGGWAEYGCVSSLDTIEKFEFTEQLKTGAVTTEEFKATDQMNNVRSAEEEFVPNEMV
jgi:hypothetical protein